LFVRGICVVGYVHIGQGFCEGAKNFFPGISIKTLENRLIHARNREFHPKTKSVEANGRGVIAIDSPPRSPAPGNFNFSRFLSNVVSLEERRGLVSKMIDAMRGELMELPGDFGENLGYDGKAIESRSTGQRSRKTGETSDPEADREKHEYSGVDSDGRAWTKIKTWFGYGLHIIADTRYELPVAFSLSRAGAYAVGRDWRFRGKSSARSA